MTVILIYSIQNYKLKFTKRLGKYLFCQSFHPKISVNAFNLASEHET